MSGSSPASSGPSGFRCRQIVVVSRICTRGEKREECRGLCGTGRRLRLRAGCSAGDGVELLLGRHDTGLELPGACGVFVDDRCRQGQHVAVEGKDRKSVVEGKRVSVRVDLGGRGIIKKKK